MNFAKYAPTYVATYECNKTMYYLYTKDPYIFSTPLNFDPRLIYKIVYGLEDYYIERGFSSKKKNLELW